jgi:AcrR family transcriptional regulator
MGAAERREQILACAVRHFEQRSYNEVSTAEIAKDAGVGRPLIHHYFGTKRELYLEVVRRLSFVPSYVPAAAVKGIPLDSLEARIEASIDRWLTVAWRHRSMWISTITMDGAGRDKEVDRILQQADEIAADRMLEALGLVASPDYSRLRVMTLAYGGLAKAASRQWLVHEALTRAEIHALLSKTMLTIVRDVAPAFSDH